jgi:hypothetical protein
VQLEGGTVSVAGSGESIYFLWAIAQPGYASNVGIGPEPNQLVVVFSNGEDQSVLTARWQDEELQIEILEGAR